MTVQLVLFAVESGNTERGTKGSLGLAKERPGRGAEALVIELLRRGMSRDNLEVACALALELDQPRSSNGDGHDAGIAGRREAT